MAKEPKRITALVDPFDYELLKSMFPADSDSSMVGNFISEMVNLVKLELNNLKIFSKQEINELLNSVYEKDISFLNVPPKNSYLYLLKNFYQFEIKKNINKKLIDKINKLT
ncbi:hypothetical protein ACFL35_18695, partial [Candidatus Riflebacteria bacterium]